MSSDCIFVGMPGGFEGFFAASSPSFSETCGSAAEAAGYIEQVAGASTGAQKRPSARNRSDEHNVGNGRGRLSQIASCERGLVSFSQGEKAVEKVVNPCRLPAPAAGEITR